MRNLHEVLGRLLFRVRREHKRLNMIDKALHRIGILDFREYSNRISLRYLIELHLDFYAGLFVLLVLNQFQHDEAPPEHESKDFYKQGSNPLKN